MKQSKILGLLAFIIIATLAQNITNSPKTIKLNKTGQTSLSVLSRNEVVVGYDYGRVQIVNIQARRVSKSVLPFSQSIRSIKIRDQDKIFAHDDKKVIMLDNKGNILRTWEARQVILDITTAYNATGFGYIGIISNGIIQEHSFSNMTLANRYYTYFETGDNGADLATYSPLHTQLYIVNGRNQKLMAVQIQKSTIFDPSFLNKTKPFNETSENRTHNFNKSSKEPGSSQNEQPKRPNFNEQQRRNFQDDGNMRNRPPPLRKPIKRPILFDRRYNFRIKQIIVDNKQLKPNNDVLVLATDQDVVYYLSKGSIITFLPYKNHTQDELISICFCQKKYLLILHRHLSESTALFYLTFFDKKSLIAEKTILLNSIFQKDHEIKAMDCNSKIIALLTENQKLLILDNQYEQIQQQTLNPLQSNDGWQIYQWLLTFVLLLVFICCCRRSKNQIKTKESEEVQLKPEQQQDGQVNEPIVQKHQDSKKTSESSSQQEQKHINRNGQKKYKNMQENEKGKHKKAKKKSN